MPPRNRIRHQVFDSSLHNLSNGLHRIALGAPGTHETAMTSDSRCALLLIFMALSYLYLSSTTSPSESSDSLSKGELEFKDCSIAKPTEDSLIREVSDTGRNLSITHSPSYANDVGLVCNMESTTEHDHACGITEPTLPALIPIYPVPSNKTVRSWGGTEPPLPGLTPIYPGTSNKATRLWGADDEILVVSQLIQVHPSQTSTIGASPCSAPASPNQSLNNRQVSSGRGVIIPSGMVSSPLYSVRESINNVGTAVSNRDVSLLNRARMCRRVVTYKSRSVFIYSCCWRKLW